MLRVACIVLALAVIQPVFAADERQMLGVILPLSGDGAEGGSACRNGMQLAYEQLEPALQQRVKLLFEDNALTPAKAVSAFKKLVDVDGANVFFTWDSGSGNALAPLVEARGLTLVTACLDPRIVNGRKRAFNYWVTPEAQAQAQIEESLRRGYRRIARVDATHDGILAIKSAFDRLNRGRLEVVVSEDFAPEVRDFRSYLTRIKTAPGIDAISVNLLFGQVGIFTKQARELGITLPFFGAESFEERSEVEASNGAMIGQWYVQTGDPSPAFLAGYFKRFPGASLYSAGNCYDIVQLVAAALREGQDLAEYLRTLKNFEGAMGTISATGDNRFTLGAIVKKVTADGFIREGPEKIYIGKD